MVPAGGRLRLEGHRAAVQRGHRAGRHVVVADVHHDEVHRHPPDHRVDGAREVHRAGAAQRAGQAVGIPVPPRVTIVVARGARQVAP